VFIIFGWVKETKEVGNGLSCYCYRCQRTRAWDHWKQTEWVSLFMVKLIPLIGKSHLVCSGCREGIAIDGPRTRDLGVKDRHGRLAEFLEDKQLANKSAVQKNYLLAQREQGRSRE